VQGRVGDCHPLHSGALNTAALFSYWIFAEGKKGRDGKKQKGRKNSESEREPEDPVMSRVSPSSS